VIPRNSIIVGGDAGIDAVGFRVDVMIPFSDFALALPTDNRVSFNFRDNDIVQSHHLTSKTFSQGGIPELASGKDSQLKFET
jgi:hypothetical protein